jgi:hypothetical protein
LQSFDGCGIYNVKWQTEDIYLSGMAIAN